MPRVARTAPKECVYHVLTRGNDRQNVFKQECDYERYLGILLKYKQRYDFKLYHYALMTNHVHLVIETMPKGGELSEIMKGINLSYAQYYKMKNRHTGHFWQDRYKSIMVSKDDYLLACGSYVELNPVRAGIVNDPKDYRWSSYRSYVYGTSDSIVDKHPIYENLSEDGGERRKKYREFIRGMMIDRESQRGEMDRRLVYGSEEFTERVTKRHKVNSVIPKRGRPKKEMADAINK
jgi:putative transposase